MLRERAKLVATKEAADKALDNAKKELAAMDEGVIAKFEAEGMTNCKVADLGTFTMKSRTYWSMKAATKEETMTALRKEYPELVKETVSAQTLSGFMNEARKQGTTLSKEITEGVSGYDKKTVSWNRT